MAIYGGPDIITDGLILHLDAGNSKSYPGTGSTWLDLSNNANHGILTNGPSYNQSNQGSIAFDGSNDYVSINNSSLLNPITNISISCWVLFNSSAMNLRNIFCGKGTGLSSSTTQYWLEKSSANSIIFYSSINNIDRLLNSNFIVSAGVWYNVTGTYNGSVMRVYVNGVLYNSSNITGSISTTNIILSVGKLGNYSSLTLNGNIAAFSLYNSALSDSNILQNYNATKGRFGL